MDEEATMMDLMRAQNSARNDADAVVTSGAENKVSSAHWLMLFFAVGSIWLAGIILDFGIPFIAVIINFLLVLALWMWAKLRGLKPPNFGSMAKSLGQAALAVAGLGGRAATGASKIVDAIPGSDLLYILFGGAISPLIYLGALWWGNRSK